MQPCLAWALKTIKGARLRCGGCDVGGPASAAKAQSRVARRSAISREAACLRGRRSCGPWACVLAPRSRRHVVRCAALSCCRGKQRPGRVGARLRGARSRLLPRCCRACRGAAALQGSCALCVALPTPRAQRQHQHQQQRCRAAAFCPSTSAQRPFVARRAVAGAACSRGASARRRLGQRSESRWLPGTAWPRRHRRTLEFAAQRERGRGRAVPSSRLASRTLARRCQFVRLPSLQRRAGLAWRTPPCGASQDGHRAPTCTRCIVFKRALSRSVSAGPCCLGRGCDGRGQTTMAKARSAPRAKARRRRGSHSARNTTRHSSGAAPEPHGWLRLAASSSPERRERGSSAGRTCSRHPRA
jgi:hypothetical protein